MRANWARVASQAAEGRAQARAAERPAASQARRVPAGCSEYSLVGCSQAACRLLVGCSQAAQNTALQAAREPPLSCEVPRGYFEVSRAKSPFKSRFAHTSEPLRSLELRAVGPRIDSASKYRILTHVSNLGL